MTLPESAWLEAEEFLRDLGCPGFPYGKAAFRDEAEKFLEILLAKNEELNLTGAKDVETLFWKHLVDSLAVLAMPDLGVTVDWGCGGGFPGIPLALARKHAGDSTPVWFVDSVGKKVRAVEEFCTELGLTAQTKGFVGRGEELIGSGTLRDVRTVMMRAVAPAERAGKWVDAAIPNWLYFLGPRQREEWTRELPKLERKKMKLRDERRFTLPRGLGQRCFLRVSKSST
jgi:16S rRNA G527 N7-methylase RsmG